jgi:predicted transcriptional regulator
LKQSSFTQAVNNNNSSSKKRNYLEINQDILKCLEENDIEDKEDGITITGLMYLSKITNSHTFYKKLEPLVGAGHIQQISLNRYKITDKGREYLKTLNEVLLPYTTTSTKPSNSKSIINKKTYRKRR